MKQIPENEKDVMTLLYQQLALLSEASKNTPLTDELVSNTREMRKLAEVCFNNCKFRMLKQG